MDLGSLTFRAFSHATEDESKVAMAVRNVSGAEELERDATQGYFGNPIIVLQARVTDVKAMKRFLESLPLDALRQLRSSLDLRMDDESVFYMRLDKQEAYLGNLVLSSGEDVISVRAKVKSYPQSRANALKAMEALLDGLTGKAERRGASKD